MTATELLSRIKQQRWANANRTAHLRQADVAMQRVVDSVKRGPEIPLTAEEKMLIDWLKIRIADVEELSGG